MNSSLYVCVYISFKHICYILILFVCVLLCIVYSDISKVQDSEVGDGTTSVVVLAGEFLRQAEKLIEKKIHPQTIIRGLSE